MWKLNELSSEITILTLLLLQNKFSTKSNQNYSLKITVYVYRVMNQLKEGSLYYCTILWIYVTGKRADDDVTVFYEIDILSFTSPNN